MRPNDEERPEPRPTARAAELETRAVLRRAAELVSPFRCSRSAECCQLARTGRQPWLWPTEWRVLAGARPLPPPREDGGCPFLDAAGRACAAYADRPLGCRTFFCERLVGPARRPLEHEAQLASRLERINRAFDESAEPQPLLWWHHRGR